MCVCVFVCVCVCVCACVCARVCVRARAHHKWSSTYMTLRIEEARDGWNAAILIVEYCCRHVKQ